MPKWIGVVFSLVLESLFLASLSFAQPGKNEKAQEKPYDPATIIVRFQEGVSPDQIKQFIKDYNCQLQGPLPIDEQRTFYTLILPKGIIYDDIAEKFGRDKRVKYVLPNIRMKYGSLSGPDFVNQIRSKNEAAFSSIGLYNPNGPDALKLAQKNGKVIVAVIDSGISPQMRQILEELNMFIPGVNITNGSSDLSDNVGHGTRMVSLLAAVSPNIQVLFIKTEQPYLSAAVDGIEYALRIAQQQQAKLVVNISFGASRADWIGSYGGDAAAADKMLNQVQADFAKFTQEAVIVASAGNGGGEEQTPGSEDVLYPARFPGVISVGATVSNAGIADYSNYGSLVSVYAPGNMVALNSYGKWWSIWGTSGAAVVVSSLAGLIWADNPNLKPDQVRDIISSTTTAIGTGDKSGKLINALAALQFVQQSADMAKNQNLLGANEIGRAALQTTSQTAGSGLYNISVPSLHLSDFFYVW